MNPTVDVHDWAYAALQRADLQIESVEAVLTGKLPDGSTRHRLSVVVTRQSSGEDNEVEVIPGLCSARRPNPHRAGGGQ